MIKSFKYLMLGFAATGSLLCATATSTLPMALGLTLLMTGAGGMSAAWMSFTDEGFLPQIIPTKELKQ